MYKLLIKVSNQQKQLFCFSDSITIGRDENCNLVLPDPSVSRKHAQIHVEQTGLITEDLGSQNGIVVDGRKMRKGQRCAIQSKSEIQLGKFSLVLLTESLNDQFYRGNSLAYLPEYDPDTLMKPTDPETVKLSNKEANSVLREQNLINKACVVDASGKKIFPETSTIGFGTAATIKAKGMFVGKVAAEISWNGKAHVLTKKGGLLCTVQVNGQAVSEQQLTVGCSITVGKDTFMYVMHSDQ